MPISRQPSRRQFLQGAAAAGTASILLPSSKRAFGYASSSERPVFATIGLRNQGWAITGKSFGLADFAALADVDASVLAENVAKVEKRQGKKPDAYQDYRKILERKDIDAVMIATPDHWHTKIAVEAMLSGKDVYCEKPLTLTIDEGKLIERIVKRTGRVFQKVTPVEYKLPVEYKDGYPTVDDRYNAATQFTIRVAMPKDVELIITSEGDNGILFEGTEGRFFVNRGKLAGKPVEEEMKDKPLPEGAVEKVYGGKVSANHTANFIEGMKARKQPISDVWSHNRMLEICHLSNIAMRLGRELEWDPVKREIVGDAQANSFLSRENRKGFEIDM